MMSQYFLMMKIIMYKNKIMKKIGKAILYRYNNMEEEEKKKILEEEKENE